MRFLLAQISYDIRVQDKHRSTLDEITGISLPLGAPAYPHLTLDLASAKAKLRCASASDSAV